MTTRHALLLALFGGVLVAQPVAQAPATFDVVSIKRSLTTESGGGSVMLPGRFIATSVPLILLLDVAYRIPPERIVGGPGWIRTERYNIEARVGNVSPDETPQMVQAMLRDRFQLKAHVEQRDAPVYALVLANADGRLGPGLRPAAFNCSDMQIAKKGLATVSADGIPGCGDRRAPGRFLGGDLPLSALEDVLAPVSGRPVVNRTNIGGRFDIKLEWTPEPGAPNGVSIFTAVREQLGLKLEGQIVPLDVLVIDSVQRPTEN